MFGINWRRTATIGLLALLVTAVLTGGLTGCGDRLPELPKPNKQTLSSPIQTRRMAEVSPPETIQELRQDLDRYQPQVKILSPKPGAVLQDTTVTARFQVKDLPIFQDANLGLGPHLHVFLDNKPYQSISDLNQPLVFSDLDPGTHTLRAFASRPWGESFKNEGAYAQTTFHIFTKTDDNNPDRTLPLLTYSNPQGRYGAEPILLDFYLTNAPLHLVAQENSEDEVIDWRIRATVNGESFVFDQWQPIYLKGFKPGKNWVQLEFIDEQGNSLKNAFNNTVRAIDYEPNGQDPLSQIVRGELAVAEVRGIVDPNYKIPEPSPEPTPDVTPTPSPEPTSIAEPELTPPTPTPIPEVEVAPPVTPTPELPPSEPEVPTVTPEPEEVASPKPLPLEEVTPEVVPTPEASPVVKSIEPTPTPTPEVSPIVKSIEPTPTPAPEVSPIVKSIESTPILVPEVSPVVKSIEPTASPLPHTTPVAKPIQPTPTSQAKPAKPAMPISMPSLEPKQLLEKSRELLEKPKQLLDKWQVNNFFNRILSPSPAPVPTTPPSTLPEIVEKAPVPQAAEPLKPGESPKLISPSPAIAP